MATFQCSICLKSFKTKQQLQCHENRRFKCKPANEDTETHGYICKCGKSYRFASGLSAHRATCPAVLQPATVKALTGGVSLNTIDKLDLSKVSEKWIKELCDATGKESELLRVRYNKESRSWTKYKQLCKYIIVQVFLHTPSNMIFYIPNFASQYVLMYDGQTFDEVTRKDMIDHIKTLLHDVIDSIIQKFDLSEYHPFCFIRLFETIDTPKTSKDCFNNLHKDLEAFILKLYRDQKHDMQSVWTQSGLI